ncbi:MAG: hypothetical protein RL264_1513 [Bacteroidota bacterium]|jgi:hypothetical protein
MNSKIRHTISNIDRNFFSIFGANINDFKDLEENVDLNDFIMISLVDWQEPDKIFLIENALIGIEYYLLNFSKVDNNKFAFPIVSYNSLKRAVFNGDNIVYIYTRNVPTFNLPLIELINTRTQ